MTNLRPGFLLVALLASSSFGWGCSSSSRPSVGGETNWLRHCQANKDCTAAGSCVCGLCSQRCAHNDDCSAGLICQPGNSALVSNACGLNNEPGLCSPQCNRASDCAGRQTCVERACAPAPATLPGTADGSTAIATGTPGAADASTDANAPEPAGPGAADASTATGTMQGRTPQAYVLSALVPDSSCVYSSDNATMQIGLLDLAPAGDSSAPTSIAPGDRCDHGYRLRLKIASDEPGVLQLSGATITLMDLQQRRIVFDRVAAVQPNPFTYRSSMTLLPAAGGETATSIFEVEVVPPRYARQLDGFSGTQVLAVISVQALDADDAPVTFRPFTYPITICKGCLTTCASALTPGTTRKDVVGDKCDDNSGTDGRICIDPGC